MFKLILRGFVKQWTYVVPFCVGFFIGFGLIGKFIAIAPIPGPFAGIVVIECFPGNAGHPGLLQQTEDEFAAGNGIVVFVGLALGVGVLFMFTHKIDFTLYIGRKQR